MVKNKSFRFVDHAIHTSGLSTPFATEQYQDLDTQGTDTLTIHWGEGAPETVAVSGGSFDITHQYLDDKPSGTPSDVYTIGVTLTGDNTGTATGSTTTTITNVAPTVGLITAPVDPVAVNTPINVSANFTDASVLDTRTAEWDWGDDSTSDGSVTESNGSGSVSGSHRYSVAGVYTVTLTVTDDDDGSGSTIFQYVVVYDPSAGFVTGGGWIDSPLGAYAANPYLIGKANFGFVAKYQKGANTPTGNTEFQFKAGDFNFRSTDYQWLVVAGSNAKFKGTGTVNGQAGFQFMITDHDGQVQGADGVDKFRIKVWNAGGEVYDNQHGESDDSQAATALGGGSIVIHNGGSNLVLDAAAGGAPRGASGLDDSQLATARADAVALLTAQGLNSWQIDRLQGINLVWADLPENTLGLASESTNYVWIDRDAAGYGWSLASATPESGRVDLFSTLTHEFGHMLGYDHDVLGASLHVGERQMVLLAEHRDHGHSELGTPLAYDAGLLAGTARLFGSPSSEFLKDGGPGRRSSRAAIDLLDHALADWSPGSAWSARPTGKLTGDTGQGSTESDKPRLETNEGLDDDLLAVLAMALDK